MEQLGTIVSKIPNECLISSQGGRNENQDSCETVDTKYGRLLIVCDGMGGGPSGKLASSLAVDAIIRNVNSLSEAETDISKILEGAIKAANQALRDNIKENRANTGMGTTAVVALVSKYCITVGHVGDSRFYQLRGTGKKCMVFRTTDHSLVMQLVKETGISEEEARLTTPSNIITRALGTQDEVEVEINELPYKSGDRLVLCSDGIWGAMPESNLLEYLTQAPSLMGTVDSVSIKVEECGMEKGGRHDNHTIIIYETQGNSLLKEVVGNDNIMISNDIDTTNKKTSKISPKILAVILTALICFIIGWAISHNRNGQTKGYPKVDSAKVATKPFFKKSVAQPTVPPTNDSLANSNILKEIDAADRDKASNNNVEKNQVASKTDSKQNDSIKTKAKSKKDVYDKELVKSIDYIIDCVRSLKSANDSTSQKNIVNAKRKWKSNVKEKLTRYNPDIVKQINKCINDIQEDIKLVKQHQKPKIKHFDEMRTNLLADLETMRSSVINTEHNNKKQ